MRGTYLHIINMAFIIISEEGQIYGHLLDSKKMEDIKGRISEATEDMTESETVMDISPEVQKNKIGENQGELLVPNDNINVEMKRKYIVHHRGNRKGIEDEPVSEELIDISARDQEKNVVEKQSNLLVPNDHLNLEIKNKYVFHHRGNRKNLPDENGEKLSGITDDNYHGKEAHDYSKVDESSEEHLDSSSNPNIFNRETTEYYAKGFGKTSSTENEYINITNSDIDYHGHNIKRDIVEVPVKQSITHEEKNMGINEESFGVGDGIDDDESYILSNVESFWDAMDAFIDIHSSSEHHEKEEPPEAEDIYEYLYTPSGNSPGIDNFLDLLLFIKDVNSAVERIEKDTQWTGEKDSIVANPETSPMDLSKVHEVNKKMDKKEDYYMSHEENGVNESEKKIKTDRSNRSKRSNTNRNDNTISNNTGKSYKHKPFKSSFGIQFPILKFDLLLSSFTFEPFMEPYPEYPDDQ